MEKSFDELLEESDKLKEEKDKIETRLQELDNEMNCQGWKIH